MCGQLRLWVFDHYKGGLGIPAEGKGGEDEAIWARFRKWLKAIEERPSLRETMSEKEHYLPIYQVSRCPGGVRWGTATRMLTHDPHSDTPTILP